ncbi:MAG: conjugal transfer protein TraF [Cellvibrionaceae bacterium]|nr:conjugal transfer protein TraF [Cellvibrionaceae bacterium]
MTRPVLLAGLAVANAPCTHAISFGIFDARALAMGGAVVAAAKTQQAQYYNPALLAFHEGREEDTRDGRFIFPTAVAQFSDSVDSAASAVEDGLDGSLSNAVAAFNASPDAQSAGLVATFARDLEDVLQSLVEEDAYLEAFTGMAVSEPSDWEGGAFYLGVRLIGIGTAEVSPEDLTLLNAYITGMEALAEGGDLDDLPAEIVDDNGNVIDPTTVFDSNADVAMLGLAEWGVSMSTSFEAYGQRFSVGITPKVLRAIAYREQLAFDTGSTNFNDDKRTFTALNLDLGFAAQFGERLRVGLAVKDLVPEDYRTGNDLTLELRPRTRIGAAWFSKYYSVGLDYDIVEHQPIADESPTQDLSLGAEFTPFSGFAFQVGYRQDTTGEKQDTFSGGLSLSFRKLTTELSYGKSSSIESAALQISWAF